MKLREVLTVLALCGLAGSVGSAVAQQDRIPLPYEELSPSDPRTTLLWSDVRGLIDSAVSNGEDVIILSTSLPTSNGGEFVVQILTGGGLCGLEECTARISEDGAPIADISVCNDYATHSLSVDGTKFYACEIMTDLTEAVPSPGLVRPN